MKMKHLGRNTFAKASEENNNFLQMTKDFKIALIKDLVRFHYTPNDTIDLVIHFTLSMATHTIPSQDSFAWNILQLLQTFYYFHIPFNLCSFSFLF